MEQISAADYRKGLKAHKPRKQNEDQLQAQCVAWFKQYYPALWEAKRLFSIPNAAKRTKIIAAIMKRTGMQAGVSDLFLSLPRGQYAGLFIELKTGNNSLSEEQERFIKAHEADYCCHVVWTFEAFQKVVTDYLKL